MDPEINIKALPLDAQRCRFTLDRPLLERGALFFASAEQAKGSPLAEALFALGDVAAVLVARETVTVTRAGLGEWPDLARRVGAAIRAQLQSGTPPIGAAALVDVPGEEEIRARVQQLLDSEINPAVGAHGGWVELLGVQENNVFLQLGGGCQGCGMADVTLKQGIETLLRREIPELGEVLDQTDHAAGRNPFYAPSKK
ncbi:MAG: NifU family protein [Candidatus Eisenbacteria bacterium]|uniref:NifU family protein n=1 Tax=Eiseniibacteriota bacterium TaxID=2212470 RepID=A0A538UCR7_UNCEI|nr:MAG: NifU family protein [Candidatus Eisenbacteria bacterium]